ncbi:hypothetical protein [Paralcaligenes ureilyticus]|uniref:Uncharacterized protein n=1 Tax=Paralcaligenes ureilyticus TaxID=627131 RepID=A0A4R3MD82_9BURK|nr:hypothetical protein [Paralcaligenes ureilyticus]TCT09475.1 hypothetical protein EDC26_10393 [Paralcaligenes ureilyticus]
MTKKIHNLHFQSEEKRKPLSLAAALRNDGSLGDLLEEYAEEDQVKLLLLCQHYGIKAGTAMFYELSLALAREIYPEPKKRGRKSKWTYLNKGALVVEVERLVKPDDSLHGVEWACGVLAKRDPWASFLEAKESDGFATDPAEALRQVYFKFRRDRWATVSRSAFKQCEHTDAMPVWDKWVCDFVRKPHPK